MPAAKLWACNRSEEDSTAQSSSDLRQLRTSCQARSRESVGGGSWRFPARYNSALPPPWGVTINGLMPAETWPSTTGSTSRARSQAWITRQARARTGRGRERVSGWPTWGLERIDLYETSFFSFLARSE